MSQFGLFEPVQPQAPTAPVPRMETLKAAQDYVHANRRDGVHCPCCGQLAKVYKRKINSGMALWLIAFYKCGAHSEPVHVQEAAKRLGVGASIRTGDYGKCRFWGLLQPVQAEKNQDKRSSGIWRLTDIGLLFVRCELKVPSHALIYDDTLLELDGEPVDIAQALGSKFRYPELMSS